MMNSVKAKLIYNPNAGKKKMILLNPTSLKDIKPLFVRYNIPVDYFPTKWSGHATELAKEAIREGYKMVLVAGGDGTVGEVANGLVHSEVPLGIIPLGSFMNVARMLSIPLDLERAVELIKIGRVRKIDMGSVVQLSGAKMEKPYYFLESAGIGLEAQLHEHVSKFESGNYKEALNIFKTLFDFYGHRGKITYDKKQIVTRATLVSVSNGPFTGANIPLAPKAKLNDHRLTLSIFKMSKWELIKYIFGLITAGRRYSRKVEVYQAKKVKIETKVPRMVHADARLYGTTPVEFKIVPNALNVISGFPKEGESTLVKRTFFDP